MVSLRRGVLPTVFLSMSTFTFCLKADHGTPPVVPSEVLPALCEHLLSRGVISAQDDVVVLQWTRPISHLLALREIRAGGELSPDEVRGGVEADALVEREFEPTEILPPARASGCNWEIASWERVQEDRAEQLILELSNVLEDPFAEKGLAPRGFFARLSVGGSFGASWYWINIAQNEAAEDWQILAIVDLQVEDG